jgi:hypothetical protein
MKKRAFLTALLSIIFFTACSQETQNRIGRGLQNWTGTNGVLEIYSGGKMMRRIIQIDKLTTAVSTEGSKARPYRYGYGVLDANENFKVDDGEQKIYFEISDYATNYFFFENPKD